MPLLFKPGTAWAYSDSGPNWLAECLSDSLGRLDLRRAEVLDYRQSFVAVRRKDGTGGILGVPAALPHLKSITNQSVEARERLSRECAERREAELFTVQKFIRESWQ